MPSSPAEDWSFLRPPLVPGDLASLGGYRILSLLGQGAMGYVFKAEDTNLHRVIALKVMRPAIAATPTSRDRLLREARAAAGLQSEFIVTIHQVGEDRGIPYIAMEHLEGMTLEDWQNRARKPVPVAAVCRVARDLLRGLAVAHESGLVHRDIKPANLWVEQKSGRVKILDFGLTRGNESAEKLTLDGAIVGTPAYMAPEQANGQSPDCRADLFSAGTVLYHLVSDSCPFQRGSLLATLSAVCNHQPLSVNSMRPDIPAELGQFIEQLMRKKPGERPASGQAALTRWIEVEKVIRTVADKPASGIATGQSSTSKTKVHDSNLLALPESNIVSTAGAASRRRKKQSSPLLAIVGTGAVVLAAVTGGWFLRPGPGKAPPEVPSQSVDRPETRIGNAGNNSSGKGTQTVAVTNPGIPGLKPMVPPVELPGNPAPQTVPPSPGPGPGKTPDTYTNTLGMEMVLVRPGKFHLGGTGGNRSRGEVEVRGEYYIARHEVTQGQWQTITGEQSSHFSRMKDGAAAVKGIADGELALFPAEMVSWDDAKAFTTRLNTMESNPVWEYRLPTEMEWEYACRGGHLMAPGDDVMDYFAFKASPTIGANQLNAESPLKRPVKVGSYSPNRLGLFDMHGNVAEWCADLYVPKNKPGAPPERIMKGGSWASPIEHARAGATFTTAQPASTWALGFRLVQARKTD